MLNYIPILKKIFPGIITLLIGVYFGFSFKQDQLDKTKELQFLAQGKYQELKSNYRQEVQEKDTLLQVVIALANKDRISVANHISDTKVKDKAQLSFVPKTTASITDLKSAPIFIDNDSLIGPKPEFPNPQEKKPKKPNLWHRIFNRNKHKKQ